MHSAHEIRGDRSDLAGYAMEILSIGRVDMLVLIQVSPPTPPTPNPKLLGVYPKRLGVLTPNVGGSRPWVVDLRRRGAEGLGLDSTLLPRHPRGGRSGPEVDRKWTTLVPFHGPLLDHDRFGPLPVRFGPLQ